MYQGVQRSHAYFNLLVMAVDTTGAFLAIEKYCVLVAVDVSKVSCLNRLATRDSGCCEIF